MSTTVGTPHVHSPRAVSRRDALGFAGVAIGVLLAVVGTFWLAFGGGELGQPR